MLEHGRKMLLIVVLLFISQPAWGEEKSNPLDQAPSQFAKFGDIRPVHGLGQIHKNFVDRAPRQGLSQAALGPTHSQNALGQPAFFGRQPD